MHLISFTVYLWACNSTRSPISSPSSEPMIQDVQNFSYQAAIDIATAPLTPGQDAFISWQSIGTDMLGHDYSPEMVSRATLVVFGGLSESDLEASIARNNLDQSNVRLLLTCTPLVYGCWLSEFNMLGTDVDIEDRFQPEEGLWLVALSTDGSNSQYSKLLLLEPDRENHADRAEFLDGESLFQVSANLTGSEPIVVPENESIYFDWTRLTRDGLGNEFSLHRIDQIDIARYKNQTLQDLEGAFLDLDSLADERWTAEVEGMQGFSTDQLDAFDGFTQEDVWMIALRCTSCGTPMPLFLASVMAVPPVD